MGQYHIIVNLDKEQYIHPHVFGDGMKLGEFGSSAQGTMLGLTLLLATDSGRGGGDFAEEPDGITGSWAGDRISIVGDYGDAIIESNSNSNMFDYATEYFEDISCVVIKALCFSSFTKKKLLLRNDWVVENGDDDKGKLLREAFGFSSWEEAAEAKENAIEEMIQRTSGDEKKYWQRCLVRIDCAIDNNK